MSILNAVSFDAIIVSAIACLALREVFYIVLPESMVGPGGWIIDTGPEEAYWEE